MERTGGEGGDKGGLGDGSAPPAVVGGGVVFSPALEGGWEAWEAAARP